MEWSATIWGLLVRYQWTLWPPTPVTLATLSMDSAPGLVGVEGAGVSQLQLVKVSKETLYRLFVECIISHTEIPCPDLPSLPNGVINYSVGGSPDNRPVNSEAMHTCSNGYTLTGSATRICVIGGIWSGSAPTCLRKWNGLCTVCLSSPI